MTRIVGYITRESLKKIEGMERGICYIVEGFWTFMGI